MTSVGRSGSLRVPAPFRDLPIFWKLLLPFLVLLMAVASIGSFIVVRDLTSRSAAALNEQLTLRALDARSLVHHRELDLIESANYATNQQGMAEAVANRQRASVAALLRSVLALKSDLAVAAAMDQRGMSIADVERSDAGRVASGTTKDWSTAAPVRSLLKQSTGTKVSGIVHVGERVMLIMVAPVCRRAPPCDRVGFAVVGIEAARIAQQIAKGNARGAEDVTLYDLDGRVVASTAQKPPPPVRLRTTSDIEQRRLRVDGTDVATAYAEFTLAGEPAGAVAVTVPAKTAFGSVGSAALRLVGLLVLAMIAAVVVGAAVSRLILRQLRTLVDTSRALGEGKLTARAPVLSDDEHGELAAALNRMAEQLEASHETLELQVEQRTEEIRRLLQDRTEFFAGLSHELRTPLAIILTQAEMLLDTASSRGMRHEATETIRASAVQLLEVVNDILELARAEAGSIDVRLGRVRLNDVLGDLRSMLVRLGAASGVDVAIDVARRLPDVTADPARLREVVVNLVDNAIKYTPSGGKIEITAAEDDNCVHVRVADTGVGIPEDVGDRVFEPFYRVTGTLPQREQPSTGLGLALTRRWVEAQGGTIGWLPNPGGGTVFEFTLPIQGTRRRRAAASRASKGTSRGAAQANGSHPQRRTELRTVGQ